MFPDDTQNYSLKPELTGFMWGNLAKAINSSQNSSCVYKVDRIMHLLVINSQLYTKATVSAYLAVPEGPVRNAEPFCLGLLPSERLFSEVD